MPLTILLHGDPQAVQQVRLGAALAGRGHQVILCNAPAIAAQIRSEYGAPCELFHSFEHGPMLLRRIVTQRKAAWRGVDIVHLNSLKHWHRMWIGGPPYVATAWGSDINDEVFRKSWLNHRHINQVLSNASAVTADSYQLLDRARTRGRLRPDVPVELVLWGVDRARFNAETVRDGAERRRAQLGIAPDQRVLLSPRQTKPHYHVDRILRAFAASLWSKDGVMVIKMYGRPEDAADRARLETLAIELGVRSKVHFAPPCAPHELAQVYAMADVAVSALEADGLPSTFCEVLALGVPLVATDLPAYRGLLKNEGPALLVAPGDQQAMVRALDRLVLEPDLRTRLRERGMSWAAEHAEWERCVDRFESLYQRVLRK